MSFECATNSPSSPGRIAHGLITRGWGRTGFWYRRALPLPGPVALQRRGPAVPPKTIQRRAASSGSVPAEFRSSVVESHEPLEQYEQLWRLGFRSGEP
jgi:hypothetical protein